MTLPKPWPRKPPKNAKCDASVGIKYDAVGKPVIQKCQEIAVETGWWGMEAWLCKEHMDSLVAKGKVIRNPRAK